MQFFLIHGFLLFVNNINKISISCQEESKILQSGALKDSFLFHNNINEFSWLKQFGELFEVANEQINWLFYNNVNQFI